MGAKGIRRRKPYRRLPPARVPDDNDAIPPHIMWPGPGSGFEAHPLSPAGRSMEGMRLLSGLRRRGGRRLPALLVVAALVMTASSLFGYLVTLLL
ncbi:MAG: hypothetical protein M3394_10475 [Actinomycetota bacterium]|nr:hypothetical protein [Actinomycetota bacterium]